MFRAAQANPFEEAVVKATDENLTSENWELILDVCDRVGASENGAKDAVSSMIKRLAHRNANVQLYTLELANALSQNCGVKMHKELASRSFTDALLRLTGDRNTHNQVKAKILERMEEWAEMFSKDPDLGIMEQAYMRLKSQNPNLHAPSKPYKQEITAADRQKEDEELQMALALSIRDKPSASGAHQPRKESLPMSPSAAQGSQPKPSSLPSGTTAATVSRVRALYDFTPSEAGELAFRKGDIIAVLESVYKDWWKGSLRGQTGIFPLNYVEKLQDPTADEIQRESQMEAEVFGQIKNVEKLLALLSTSSSEANARDSEEITSLYHQTTAIRPKLVELIQKYSQKKDDFTQLNEKFIKARKDYEALLDASMSQPHQYGRPPPPGPGYGGPVNQGYPPPQQQQAPPQRYYPSSNQHETDPLYSQPTGGPAPFYMIPPGQQAPPPQQQAPPPQSHDQRLPKPTSPVYNQHTQAPPPQQPQQQQQVPNRQSMYGSNPQELATSQYDTPSYPPQQQVPPQQTQYSPIAQHPQHDQHDQYYTSPPQPSNAPPHPPVGGQGPGSPSMSSNIPPFGGQQQQQQQPPQPQQQQPPPQQQYQAYQAYQPPRQENTTPSILRAGAGQPQPPQDASDYYR